VVINASNLHTGGGIQVAVSFFQELAELPPPRFRMEILASTEISDAVDRIGLDRSRFAHFETFNTYGVFRGMNELRRRLSGADAVFLIFGPSYLVPKPRRSIVGFAQAWILYPRND